MADGLFFGLCGDSLRHGLRDRQHLREVSQQGEGKVSKAPANLSVIEPSRAVKRFAAVLVIGYALVTIVPMLWIFLTSFKSPQDSIAYPPKILFQPSMEGYVNLFTARTRQTPQYLASLPPPTTWYDRLVRSHNMVIAGPSRFAERFWNSAIIGFGSTFLSVFLGTLAAYGFSRFQVPIKDDLMFFILSTRMMPPIAVAIPIFLMYRKLGLSDTHVGMILLYTAVNISLAVWLLKGFVDEIPREYEEAAMIDGYTRLQAFVRVVLPQMLSGIAATAIFCLIFAWNEYAFALLLTSGRAQTAPPFIPTIIGEGGLDWPAVGAGATLFMIPVVFFTILLRKNLLRGITFGALRK
jgi:multiple sugar transport system permease protein